MQKFIFSLALFLSIGTSASAESANNLQPETYTKTFDNLPAKWKEFYLGEDKIQTHKGEEVDEILMTKLIYGRSADGTKLAGGHWFTVIGKNLVLVKDENEKTHLIETRNKCKALKRAKYLFLGNDIVEIKYRRLDEFVFTTRLKGGFANCQITAMYEWNGPTYYLDNIEQPVRKYRASR